uniref:Glycerol-3-phosphate dehydrogenase [NAD(+)] n=1 Tax=Nephromyces sp. MMRI TaxID=2496275 RepID=A0A3Q8UBN6_9APIC|nr:glucose-6-phosphate 1-dehydrogenase [Nephromyces sp. MMRI]
MQIVASPVYNLCPEKWNSIIPNNHKTFFFKILLILNFFANSTLISAYSFSTSYSMPLLQTLSSGPLKVAVIGSGNWGSVIGKIVASNAKTSYIFDENVRIWVYEELIEGKKLTEIFNQKHENVKYLPGVPLPENLTAHSSLKDTIRDANLLVFVIPHQFLKSTCETIKAFNFNFTNTKAISLVKGLYIDNNNNPKLSSELISEILGLDCSVLSGANVAKDVAKEEFSEATIGFDDKESADVWQQLFDKPYFKITGVPDISGVEVCGALKNVIALAAGFCDGMDMGSNTKAAIIRQGFEELRLFSTLFYNGTLEDTFFDSAGIADTITTCFGGRNLRCAAEFVKSKGTKSWSQIESEFLNGQKLQGTLTCYDLFKIITSKSLEQLFPLFTVTYKIAYEGMSSDELINEFKVKKLRRIKSYDDCTLCVLPAIFKDKKRKAR